MDSKMTNNTPKFSHLHVHTQYSILDGKSTIKGLLKRAEKDNNPAVAITDHGNMMAAFEFVATAEKLKSPVKTIIGCEPYIVDDLTIKSFKGDVKDKRNHLILLAKNINGYNKLCQLQYISNVDGKYSKYPRIDKKHLEEVLLSDGKSDVIVMTACIAGVVPSIILSKGEAAGETELLWWKDKFGDDFYVEIQRHGIDKQDRANNILIKLARKHNIKIIATNDVHYIDKSDFLAHENMLAIQTKAKMTDPIRDYDDEDSNEETDAIEEKSKGKGKQPKCRFSFKNDCFYMKSTEEMLELFKDVPEAIHNTNEIVDKIERYTLKRPIKLPNFPIDYIAMTVEEWRTKMAGQWSLSNKKIKTKVPYRNVIDLKKLDINNITPQYIYLEHLVWEGAKERYKTITDEVKDRIQFELSVIKNMGFSGYFLIVADYIRYARSIGGMVGHGRGSAAGSAVTYCLRITNIDPIEYQLLFERFLNPDRISMPDIDTDFAEDVRDEVIKYVVNKYGSDSVAQIVTYGTMAAKSAIKDVAKVNNISIDDANKLSKKVADGISIEDMLHGDLSQLLKEEKINNDDKKNIESLRTDYNDDTFKATLDIAQRLEGTIRQTGIHACGIVIAPEKLSNLMPVMTAKDSDMILTQFESTIIEDAGVIKMDVLGLKTLDIISDCLKFVKESKGININIDTIPFDDEKTFKLFQDGHTKNIFQFESDGMVKNLKLLKPTRVEDLIAMNALYRPGPMQYIPNFIARKNGKEEIKYDIDVMENILSNTYGITVYQEQVMQLSQLLGGFTKGEADTLRKGMGKKDKAVLDKMKPKFITQAIAKGHNEEVLNKIWNDWEEFTKYAFNKSHATCYAVVAYQTAYLKANYPSEYMAAALKRNLDKADKKRAVLAECKRMKIEILPPSVNYSNVDFCVDEDGNIRFGLGGIKGFGVEACKLMINDRKVNGLYKDMFNLVTRSIICGTKKSYIEKMILAGALDEFNVRRDILLSPYGKENTYLNHVFEAAKKQYTKIEEKKNSGMVSLFAEVDEEDSNAMNKWTNDFKLEYPSLSSISKWSDFVTYTKEKEVIGMYISGHPLNDYSSIIEKMYPKRLYELDGDLEELNEKTFNFACIVAECEVKAGKSGYFCSVVFEDLDSSKSMMVFSKQYTEFGSLLYVGSRVLLSGVVKRKYKLAEFPEFVITDIIKLSDAATNIDFVTVTVPISKMNSVFLDTLEGMRVVDNGFVCIIKTVDGDVMINYGNPEMKFDAEALKLFDEMELDYVINK